MYPGSSSYLGGLAIEATFWIYRAWAMPLFQGLLPTLPEIFHCLVRRARLSYSASPAVLFQVGRENVEFARGRNDGMEIPDQPKEEVKFRSRGRILIGFASESLFSSLSPSLSLSVCLFQCALRDTSATLLNRCPSEREHTKLNEHL